ncbi:hypothetical protein [Fodinibius halophilus]|uniref:Uncharacterized protein n=1 Tax=Fodinibius halophilus TaxID=1736908 RepID=A0A6M1TPT8_9BACT|nr:hypothetical protein [Fodinibius halophilus]NGP90250.1 hypothetical protein [Fodinibius halophilus]
MTNDEKIEPAPVEKTILRLEKSNRIWPFLIFNLLLILVGINSIVHNNYEAGIAFFFVTILLYFINKDKAAEFLGTSSQALLIVLHITLFGVHPFAILTALIFYLIFKRLIDQSPFGSISIYILIDSIIEFIEPIWGVSEWVNSIGEKILVSEFFYSLLTLIPLTYLFLRIERYFKKNFNNPILKENGSYLTIGTICCILFPIAYYNLDNILSITIIPAFACFFIYFIGLINLVNRKPQKGVLVNNIPLIILFIEFIIIKAIENN